MPDVTILGIDPGSRITGYGVIRMENSRANYVTSGCIKVADLPLADRLRKIFDGLSEIACEFTPDQVAIEKIFMSRNPDSALKLGQARGTAIVACARQDLPIYEYSATEIKQAIVGRGHADKEQIQHMIKALLSVEERQADAADALAAALCHGHTADGLAALSFKPRSRVRRGRGR